MENHGQAQITVTRTGGGFGRTTVDYLSFSGTTNVADGDFQGRFGRVRFAPYEYLETFQVVVNDDDMYGAWHACPRAHVARVTPRRARAEFPDENFRVRLEAPSGGAVLGRTEWTQAIVWILNDDRASWCTRAADPFSVPPHA